MHAVVALAAKAERHQVCRLRFKPGGFAGHASALTPRGNQAGMATYYVNPAARQRAQQLIQARQYVLDSDWGSAQPRADAENAFLERHSWQEYGAWHLGLTDGANDETKSRYAFVFGDFRRIHRTGLIACVYRAAEWRHKDIELAAYQLLQELDTAAGITPTATAQ